MAELSADSNAAAPAQDRPAPSRRRRGSRVADAVLDATLALLAERGYSLGVEDVAVRARVHKTTIYRRFTSKASLVGAALEHTTLLQIPVPESGDPLVDLVSLAEAVARSLNGPDGARILRAVVVAASEDSSVLTVARRYLAGRFDAAAAILGRAAEAGQLRAGVDPVLLWGAVVNPLQVRALLGHPVSEETARDLVALALAGARNAPG